MRDSTPEGRRLHALHAAQIPFSGEMDDVLDRLWGSGGHVVSRIRSVSASAPFRVPDDVILRELTALAVGHSKSTVPAALFADFPRFRRVLQHSVLVGLEDRRHAGGALSPDDDLPSQPGANARFYADPGRDAFAWVDFSPIPHTGHSQKTRSTPSGSCAQRTRCGSGGRHCEPLLGTRSSSMPRQVGAIFLLRTSAGDRLFLLRLDSPLSAGEANLPEGGSDAGRRPAHLVPPGPLQLDQRSRGRLSRDCAGRRRHRRRRPRGVRCPPRRRTISSSGACSGLDARRARASGRRTGVRRDGGSGNRPLRSAARRACLRRRRPRRRVTGRASAYLEGIRSPPTATK